MAAARKKTEQTEPAKVDLSAPPPTPETATVRARASRPAFRRGGLVFNDRDWTVIGQDLSEEALLAVLAEPVLTIQVRTPDGWRAMTPDERQAEIAMATNLPANKAG